MCGVILYVLLSGSPPFTGLNEHELYRKIHRGMYGLSGPRWDAISKPAKEFIKNMIMVDPNKRYSALDALNHSWIQGSFNKKIDTSEAKSLLCGLRTFTTQYKLQQAALEFIVSQLITNKEKKQLQEIFLSLDKDHDGKIGKEELVKAYKEVFGEDYPAEEEVEKMINQIDISGDGYINLTEFIVATMSKKSLLSRNRLVAAFNMFDKDDSGGISADEVKEVLGVGTNISDAHWKDIIMEVDLNGDGEITLDEFIKMMHKVIELAYSDYKKSNINLEVLFIY
jgi:calcium-dependent protein kinase